MSENLHNIDKLFKNAIEGHEELPTGDVWNNIDKGLDKNKVVSIQRKYYVLKRVAVAVFIFGFVASVFAIYFNSRYYNPQAKNDNPSINNQVIVKSNEKISQKPVANKFNTGRENQSSTITDANQSSSKKVINSNPSTSASHSNDAALSSEDYNKINQETLSSNSPTITTAKIKRTKIFLQNKSDIVSGKDQSNQISSTVKGKNKIESALKQTETKDNTSKAEARISESIVANHLLYAFQPVFNKSFNHSDIAPAIAPPISKLKKQPHLAVTVFAGPEKNITHLKDPPQPMRPGNRDEFRHSEKSKSSVRTGLLFDYPFASNWSIGSGIIYTSNVTSIDPKIVFARQDDRGNIKYEFNCSAGYAYIPSKTGSTPLIGDSAKVSNSKTHISYVSVPLTAGYNLSAGKFILKPSAGLLLNFLTTGKVQSEISSNSMNPISSINTISGLKSSYLSGEVNFTAIYQVNNKIGIMVAPNTQFALTSINKNTSVKTYPGYVGVIGGVRVAF